MEVQEESDGGGAARPVQQPRSAPGGGLARHGNGEKRATEGAGHSAGSVMLPLASSSEAAGLCKVGDTVEAWHKVYILCLVAA